MATRIFDIRFSVNKWRYLMQCVLATVSAVLVLLVLDSMANKVVMASLGASCFIAFCVPHKRASSPRLMVGGYIVGIAVGTLFYFAKTPWLNSMGFVHNNSDVIFGGLAIGLAMFVMVVTNTEHPPAASLALGLVLCEWQVLTVAVTLVEIVILCVIKRLFKPILIDLL